MRDTITLADDADLAHLVDLIDMLPSPDETDFWGEEPLAIGKKFAFRLRAVLTGRAYPKDVDYLAVYVLKYLGRGNGYITEEQITKSLRGAHGIPAAGYAWVEDATRTAWTLATRYSLPNWRGPRSAPGQAWLQD
ncbi:hypothetical protein ABT095_33815 [Kitasatospora sp. NPDC002227]|uniref:hypothetical protein n=1 Tax=Kitasatospora sp. NPDC002227 TaxID=3154773 RepID=UPI00332568FA